MVRFENPVQSDLVECSIEWLQEQYATYKNTYRHDWALRCKAEMVRRKGS